MLYRGLRGFEPKDRVGVKGAVLLLHTYKDDIF